MVSRQFRFAVQNPEQVKWPSKHTVPNAYVLKRDKWWQRLAFKWMARYGMIVGTADYTLYSSELTYKEVSFDISDVSRCLLNHIDKLTHITSMDVEKIILGKDVYHEFIRQEFHDPYNFHAQDVLRQMRSTPNGTKNITTWHSYEIQLIPWFSGVLVVPKRT
jgi:hypothetical protein